MMTPFILQVVLLSYLSEFTSFLNSVRMLFSIIVFFFLILFYF